MIHVTATFSCRPEYGPPPYMPFSPDTGSPAADLWDVTNAMAERLRERFAARSRDAYSVVCICVDGIVWALRWRPLSFSSRALPPPKTRVGGPMFDKEHP
jgi:hypothetical protein